MERDLRKQQRELRAERLSFSYASPKARMGSADSERKWILRDVSFALKSGERLGLLGPSGVGKSTLCRILAGYERPQSGKVLLDGLPVPAGGYCPVQLLWQHPEQAVNPRWRMKQVLAEAGIGEEKDEALLSRLGIRKVWMDRFPGELSGGELQRFCLARALREETAFLLADEITTMLDLVTQEELWQFLTEEAERRNLGILMVSHSPQLVRRFCTGTIRLDP